MDYIAQTPDVGLCADDAESLFGNIEDIYHFNRCVILCPHAIHSLHSLPCEGWT